MSKYTIYPYVSDWNGQRVWVFDDLSKGLINEGLVSGTDKILDLLASSYGEEGFELTFSDQQFDCDYGITLVLEWIRTGVGEGLAEGVEETGIMRRKPASPAGSCPALFKYFDTAPKHIYILAKALTGTLERGTGKIVIQGK